jgi:hypothetical protein
VEQHEGEQSRGFRFFWQQFRQHLGQGDSPVAQVPPDEVIPGAGRVSLVEYQVEHRKDAWYRLRQGAGRRYPVGDARVGDLVLGPDEPLGIVASVTKNARAISAVPSPVRVRSVNATRASIASAGWQRVKISRSRSSGTPLSPAPSSGLSVPVSLVAITASSSTLPR